MQESVRPTSKWREDYFILQTVTIFRLPQPFFKKSATISLGIEGTAYISSTGLQIPKDYANPVFAGEGSLLSMCRMAPTKDVSCALRSPFSLTDSTHPRPICVTDAGALNKNLSWCGRFTLREEARHPTPLLQDSSPIQS
jgi:hypothetical protein